jgi:hypothetical protein
MDEALKLVWAYIIENGVVTSGKWEYYAGGFECEYIYDYTKRENNRKALIEKVRQVGVDWTKTKSPESSMESCFEGTFSDSSDVETLLGTLYLKDGSEYLLGVANVEKRFSAYVETIAELMADKERVKNILGE